MKKYFFIFLMLVASFAVSTFAQESNSPTPAEINDRFAGIDENVTTLLTDVAGLKKMKISGYFQFEFNHSFDTLAGFGASPYDASKIIQDRFRVRRSRLKFNYDMGVSQVVIQADFSNSGFELKDAYMSFAESDARMFNLTMGVFNRPSYEVEYSSSQRESMERSAVVAALYPKERDLGAMFTFDDPTLFKLQVAGFNNTFKGDLSQFVPVSSENPFYLMARATKSLSVMEGLDIDFGVSGRFGSVTSNSKYSLESDIATKAKPDSTTLKVGDGLSRSWFGAEAQIYWDFFGGMKVIGEFITGSDVNELPLSSVAASSRIIRKRSFSGFYAMLVKNIGTEWQIAAKYDSFNPNTGLDSDKKDNASELAINTVNLTLHNYTFSNVRISAQYDMISTTIHPTLMKEDPKDDLFTLRFQYKF